MAPDEANEVSKESASPVNDGRVSEYAGAEVDYEVDIDPGVDSITNMTA